jgi:hypothetical protein
MQRFARSWGFTFVLGLVTLAGLASAQSPEAINK